MPPEKLGRYQILREIGRGAMGVVYEADDPNIGRRVAIKTIRADSLGANPDEVARRFKNEARAAGGLNHPNIVTIYDAGEQDGTLYLAMEFMEGSTLDALLRAQRSLHPSRAVEIVRQVCAGLDYAHAKGVVHRDIKPGNVMLAADGTVKITDFGIARTAEAMTMTGQVLGTPNYMSPEQVMGKPVDGRSDLFSVGVMLYEMLTGERPFDGQSITTIMYKIVHETPIAPQKLDSTIHPGLSAIVEKSLAKSAEMRYQTGSEFAAGLQNYMLSSTQLRNLSEQATVDLTSFEEAGSSPKLSAPSLLEKPSAVRDTGAVAEVAAGRRRKRHISRAARILIAAGVIAVISLIGAYRRFQHWQASPSQSSQAPDVNSSVPEPAIKVLDGPEAVAHPQDSGRSNSDQSLIEHKPASGNKQIAVLKLNSSPPGAEVHLDGEASGKTTPVELQLPKGDHSVTVQLEGFQPASVKVRVRGGEQLEFSPNLSVMIPKVSIPNLPDIAKITKEGQAWQQWGEAVRNGALGLIVSCKPVGAHILVDGNDTGKTSPAIIPEKPGTYNVRCEMPGYNPDERVVTVGPQKPGKMSLTLQPIGQQ